MSNVWIEWQWFVSRKQKRPRRALSLSGVVRHSKIFWNDFFAAANLAIHFAPKLPLLVTLEAFWWIFVSVVVKGIAVKSVNFSLIKGVSANKFWNYFVFFSNGSAHLLLENYHWTSLIWSGKRDSNARHFAWKANALPAELFPHLWPLVRDLNSRHTM